MTDSTPPLLTPNDDGSATLTFPTDDYTLHYKDVSPGQYGSIYAEVTARDGTHVLHTARFDLLNQHEQQFFHQRCQAVNGNTVDWQSRSQSALPGLRTLLQSADASAQRTTASSAVWSQAITAQEFLQQEDPEVAAYAKDLVVAGCITVVSAPRASGKSLVALYLGVALAQGGVFRDEKLTRKHVLLLDRDNSPALVRKRLRWLGAQDVTDLRVLTRDKAPPLSDRASWQQFPVADYDVVIVDSLGAATEGVSEKEGKQTQEFLATLKDLAHRGPAILALDNTNKAATNYRGRGEKADAVDILYESRNITKWTPDQAGDWWESLPEYGDHTWQQRASRHRGQTVLRIAFIPSKFRLGIEPEPFALEIDTRQEPWSLADVTAQIATAGEQAADEARRQEQARVRYAEETLVKALTARAADKPMLKSEAEALLVHCGLKRQVARNLIERGGNRDITPDGRWILRPVPPHNRATAVHIADDGGGNDKAGTSRQDTTSSIPSSADSPLLDGGGSIEITTAPLLEAIFKNPPPSPCYSTAEEDMTLDEQPCGSDACGVSSAVLPHSNEQSCPMCGCDALMDCRTYLKCPICLWTTDGL